MDQDVSPLLDRAATIVYTSYGYGKLCTSTTAKLGDDSENPENESMNKSHHTNDTTTNNNNNNNNDNNKSHNITSNNSEKTDQMNQKVVVVFPWGKAYLQKEHIQSQLAFTFKCTWRPSSINTSSIIHQALTVDVTLVLSLTASGAQVKAQLCEQLKRIFFGNQAAADNQQLHENVENKGNEDDESVHIHAKQENQMTEANKKITMKKKRKTPAEQGGRIVHVQHQAQLLKEEANALVPQRLILVQTKRCSSTSTSSTSAFGSSNYRGVLEIQEEDSLGALHLDPTQAILVIVRKPLRFDVKKVPSIVRILDSEMDGATTVLQHERGHACLLATEAFTHGKQYFEIQLIDDGVKRATSISSTSSTISISSSTSSSSTSSSPSISSISSTSKMTQRNLQDRLGLIVGLAASDMSPPNTSSTSRRQPTWRSREETNRPWRTHARRMFGNQSFVYGWACERGFKVSLGTGTEGSYESEGVRLELYPSHHPPLKEWLAQPGDVVGVQYDAHAHVYGSEGEEEGEEEEGEVEEGRGSRGGRIVFYRNGVSLGLAFHGIDRDKKWFPFVCLDRIQTQVRLLPTRRPPSSP